MKSISYTSLIVSITLLYWCTSIAYNRVIRIDQPEFIPVFHRQKCIITHLDLEEQSKLVDDLNIYYSGVKKPQDLPKPPIVNQDAKIQEEILKVVKEKQTKVEEKTEAVEVQKTPDVKKEKKEVKASEKKLENQKQAKGNDDAFSLKKKPTSKSNQPKKNVFDVIE